MGLAVVREKAEFLYAPAETHRCRVYKITLPVGIFEPYKYVELWDFVEEPYEYRRTRKGMPGGELVFGAESYSKHSVLDQVRKYEKSVGVIIPRDWNYPGCP